MACSKSVDFKVFYLLYDYLFLLEKNIFLKIGLGALEERDRIDTKGNLEKNLRRPIKEGTEKRKTDKKTPTEMLENPIHFPFFHKYIGFNTFLLKFAMFVIDTLVKCRYYKYVFDFL